MPQAKRLNHVQIVVGDLARSGAFYTGVFGLEEESRDQEEDGSTLVFLRTSDGFDVITLQAKLGLTPIRGTGVDHFGFWVPDAMEETLEAVTRHGGEVLGRASWNPGRFAYVRDPDGYVVEINALPDDGQ
jgi:catechol 2,3-dioxygenase-like lactoylglutathione lyase family enzyme